MKTKSKLNTYFLAGLLTLVPIVITVFVASFIIKTLYRLVRLPFLSILKYDIPGMEIIVFFAGLGITVIVIVLTGALTFNLLGRRLISFWENIISKVPLINSIYTGVKQLVEAMSFTKKNSFARVVLVEYPKKDIYSLGFTTKESYSKIREAAHEKEMLTIIIPTTPNPTSGLLIMVPAENAKPLDITVEEAFKLIISGGIVTPGD